MRFSFLPVFLGPADGLPVGALGFSGAMPDEDAAIARLAIDRFSAEGSQTLEESEE